MDATATLNKITSQFSALDQRKLSRVVAMLLVIYLLFMAADLTWKLIPSPQQSQVPSSIAASSQQQAKNSSVDINAVNRLNLFGELGKTPAKPVAQQTVVPVTKLNLTLSGVVATGNPKAGAAVIENRGKQATYGINDKVDGTRAFLREIYPDRVILEHAGKRETLMLEGIDYSSLSATPVKNAPRTNSPRRPKQVIEGVQQARQDIMANPKKITDYIRISPVRKAGQLQGYRLMPGKSPQFFRQSGLRPNDLATSINGYDLTDTQNAMMAMNELRTSDNITLTISRNGEIHSIDFSVPQGNE